MVRSREHHFGVLRIITANGAGEESEKSLGNCGGWSGTGCGQPVNEEDDYKKIMGAYWHVRCLPKL